MELPPEIREVLREYHFNPIEAWLCLYVHEWTTERILAKLQETIAREQHNYYDQLRAFSTTTD